MTHFGHDMDHDGKITSKDTGMFHEMMDEDEKSSYSHKYLCENGYSRKQFWTRAAIAFACCCFSSWMLEGALPINLLTIVLGIGSGIASLLLILDLAGVAL